MCAQVGGRRKLGHSDAVFRTCGGARLRALHLAETKAVLVGILRGMVAIELVIRDALAFEHRQSCAGSASKVCTS